MTRKPVEVTKHVAMFTDGTETLAVTFGSQADAEAFGRTWQVGTLIFAGTARKINPMKLKDLAAQRYLETPGRDGRPDGTPFTDGLITHWEPGKTFGFLADSDGTRWFVHSNAVPGQRELTVGTRVRFVGNPQPEPGKTSPRVHTITSVEEPPDPVRSQR